MKRHWSLSKLFIANSSGVSDSLPRDTIHNSRTLYYFQISLKEKNQKNASQKFVKVKFYDFNILLER